MICRCQTPPTWVVQPTRSKPRRSRLERYGIADRDPAGRHRRPVHPNAGLAVTTERTQDRRAALGRLRVNVDHDATLVSLVDAHPHVADTQYRADPCVLRAGRVVGRLDDEIGTEPQGIQLGTDSCTEVGD